MSPSFCRRGADLARQSASSRPAEPAQSSLITSDSVADLSFDYPQPGPRFIGQVREPAAAPVPVEQARLSVLRDVPPFKRWVNMAIYDQYVLAPVMIDIEEVNTPAKIKRVRGQPGRKHLIGEGAVTVIPVQPSLISLWAWELVARAYTLDSTSHQRFAGFARRAEDATPAVIPAIHASTSALAGMYRLKSTIS